MKEILLLIIFLLSYFLVKLLKKEAIFIPLPMKTVEKILELAEIKKKDILYDLGSGDGRIVIMAAKRYGIKAVGIEKNIFLYFLSKIKVKINGVEDKVKIIHGDLFKQKISEASIVTIYLTQKLNDKLEPKLKRELKRGTKIISADHTLNMKEIRKVKAGHLYLHFYKI